MRMRRPNLLWAGMLLGLAYWILESALHAYVFQSGTLLETLVCAHDPNELWMRSIVTILLAAFGWASERRVSAERREKVRAEKLNHLFQYVHQVRRHAGAGGETEALGGDVADGAMPGEEDEIGRIVEAVQGLSQFLDTRVEELHSLLEMTHEINKGMLVEEVLEKTYHSFRSVIPYNRIGVALLSENGRKVSARWVRMDGGKANLHAGFSAPMAGSSLQMILDSGEPRILNDLGAYLDAHPHSVSTRLIVNEGIRSSLTCPLVAAGRPLGFIFFSSREAGAYKDAHVDVFKTIAGQLSVVIEKSQVYEELIREKETSEALLLNVMPARIIANIKAGVQNPVEELLDVGVLFADIVGFSEVSRTCPAEAVVGFLQNVFTQFDALCETYGVEKIKTIGDAYMACSVSNADNKEHLLNLARFSRAMLGAAATVQFPDGQPLKIRVGLHIGPVIAGVIGQKKFAYDLWGDTVNIAQRLESTGIAGEVLVTENVRTHLGDDFRFEPRGEIALKGTGSIATYFLKEKTAKA